MIQEEKGKTMIVCDHCRKIDHPANRLALTITHVSSIAGAPRKILYTLPPNQRLDLCGVCEQQLVREIIETIDHYNKEKPPAT